MTPLLFFFKWHIEGIYAGFSPEFGSLKQKYLDAEKEAEPVKGAGIVWENNGQPPKILHRAKADEDDEERLLGWHADAELLTVCF